MSACPAQVPRYKRVQAPWAFSSPSHPRFTLRISAAEFHTEADDQSSFGRSLGYGMASASVTPQPVLEVCRRLFALSETLLPPAFVVDVGLIEDRGWAVVEFNPAWCSGLRSAKAELMLDMLRRSCRARRHLAPADRRWVLRHPGGTQIPLQSGCGRRHH